MVNFNGENFKKKEEFHITFLGFAAQRKFKKINIEMEEVGNYIMEFLNKKDLALELSESRPVVLEREYKERKAFEKSVVVLLEERR
jgi:hypothetical protein